MPTIRRSCSMEITNAFKVNPVVGLLGPRQVGKSTLARQWAASFKSGEVTYFDLENPADQTRLSNPILALEDLSGLIIIDEIQKHPKLFEYLRVLVDQKKRKIKILVLGSASRDLIQQSSETLAGRISYVELAPFSLREVTEVSKLHLRGGFPNSFLASSEARSFKWRNDYVASFLERDLFDFGYSIAPSTIRRFWMMLAHYHGQILNFSELSRSFGVSDMTVRRYLELLSETFMIRLLQPWHENISKRQVKAPKLYIRDSGIFHSLLGVGTRQELATHPKLGASWEGFALEQTIRAKAMRAEDCYFWNTHSHAELDLLVFEKTRRIGYEFKFADTPKLTKSLQIAMADLSVDHLFLVTPKGQKYSLAPRVTAIGLEGVV
jgi:predicted AAA+ superfamily ATPase